MVYLYSEHLGSIDVITDKDGVITQSMSFDPWGARRNGEDWTAMGATDAERVTNILKSLEIDHKNYFQQPITNQGFTGHEMVDDVGIIHMNGRIYDPVLGRFLQADPHIDGAKDTQGYNRYSYVQNNPLNTTDPSGFSSLRQFLGAIVATVMTLICQNAACGEYAWAVIAGFSGLVQAMANGGNMAEGVVTSLVTAMIFHGIGDAFKEVSKTNMELADAQAGAVQKSYESFGLHNFGGNWLTSTQVVEQVGVHALAGGTLAYAQGGNFGSGFISAGMTKAFTNVEMALNSGGTTAGGIAVGAVVSAVIGGTVSELSGGKFANGANTAAFQFLFNALNDRRTKAPTKELKEIYSHGDYDTQLKEHLLKTTNTLLDELDSGNYNNLGCGNACKNYEGLISLQLHALQVSLDGNSMSNQFDDMVIHAVEIGAIAVVSRGQSEGVRAILMEFKGLLGFKGNPEYDVSGWHVACPGGSCAIVDPTGGSRPVQSILSSAGKSVLRGY